jgi:adenosylmethionine-8-amino-7-oxononanoate aminotransferase
MTHAFLHPFADPAKDEAAYINIVRAEGAEIFDDTGKAYIDAMASLWYCQVGHGRREIIDAIAAQLSTLDVYNTFDPFTNDRAATAAEMIAERSPMPDGRVFLSCSGSEAVDTALKLARLVQQRRGPAERQIIVRRTRGYHGTNFGGTSAQGIAPNRDGWGDLVPHFVEVDPDDIEAMATLFADHGERIAAVITEPVQGAGGVFPPPEGYLAGVRRLCDDNGALLIFDEVICGFGRTGCWFGAQTFGVTPDLITFAKGVTSGYQPVSGVIVGRGVADELESMGTMLRTGYTYSGNPAGAAAVIANLELMDAEGLVERANHLGVLFDAGLGALAADGTIEHHAGIGGVWAVELGRDSIPVRNEIIANGVILRAIGTRLAICPPLTTTDAQVATIIDTLRAALV